MSLSPPGESGSTDVKAALAAPGTRGQPLLELPEEPKDLRARAVAGAGKRDAARRDALRLESQVRLPQPREASDDQRRRNEHHERQRDLRHHQDLAHALPARRPYADAVAQRRLQVRPRGLRGRREAEQEAGERGQRCREEQDLAVEGHLRRPGQHVRHEADQPVERPRREDRPQDPARERQRHALEQEQAHQPAAACADGRANRHLALARAGAREQQVGDVRDRQCQQRQDRGHQHQQRQSGVADDPVVRPLHVDSLLSKIRVLPLERPRDHLHAGLGGVERDAVGQARHDTQEDAVVGGLGQVQATRTPHLGLRVQHAGSAPGRDTDHLVRLAGQHDGSPEDATVAAETGPPQLVAEDDHARRARHIVRLAEIPSELRGDAERREVPPRHLLAAHRLRLLAVERQRGAPAGHCSEGREDVALLLPVAHVARRGPLVGRTAARGQVLPDHHQLLRRLIRQRPQEHAVHQAEDGCGGADAHGKGENHGGAESRRAGECPEDKAHVRHAGGRAGTVPAARASAGNDLRELDAPPGPGRCPLPGRGDPTGGKAPDAGRQALQLAPGFNLAAHVTNSPRSSRRPRRSTTTKIHGAHGGTSGPRLGGDAVAARRGAGYRRQACHRLPACLPTVPTPAAPR